MTEQCPARKSALLNPRLAVALIVGINLVSLSPAYAERAIQSFASICGKATLSFDDRLAGLKSAGWDARQPGMWNGYHAMLEEAIVATSIEANASANDWSKTKQMAAALREILDMRPADRESAGIADFNAGVLVPHEGTQAVLLIVDEGFVTPGKIHCIYSGPMPADAAALVKQMESYGWTEKSDEYVHQFSVDETTNLDGSQVKSAQLIAILQSKSSTFLGTPPLSEASLSVFTQPLNR